MSSFQIVYGYPSLAAKIVRSKMIYIVVVEDMLQKGKELDHSLQRQLDMARNRMKQMVDKGRIEREFQVGE